MVLPPASYRYLKMHKKTVIIYVFTAMVSEITPFRRAIHFHLGWIGLDFHSRFISTEAKKVFAELIIQNASVW